MQMAYALLLGTLGKIDPQAAKACEKVIGKIPLIDHSPWPKHQRCELNPDLDNTSHFLASSNTKPAKTAWRPPKHGRHIPCNALIATQKGQGVAAIRNADHDLPMLIKSGRVILGLKKLKGKGKNSNM